MHDPAFANILLSGPCSLRCPDCIRHALPTSQRINTLGEYPLPGLFSFVRQLRDHRITQVSLTGTCTEPLLYAHHERLTALLRARLPGVQLSLHTNGSLILSKLAAFHRYDRATISLPSFRPHTCAVMTGSSRVLPLSHILAAARIPIKVSTLLTPHNEPEIPEILARFASLGIRRVVIRQRYGSRSRWSPPWNDRPVRWFGGNPVYQVAGMEVTVWDFTGTKLRCLNLLPDGTSSPHYLLAGDKPEAKGAEAPTRLPSFAVTDSLRRCRALPLEASGNVAPPDGQGDSEYALVPS